MSSTRDCFTAPALAPSQRLRCDPQTRPKTLSTIPPLSGLSPESAPIRLAELKWPSSIALTPSKESTLCCYTFSFLLFAYALHFNPYPPSSLIRSSFPSFCRRHYTPPIAHLLPLPNASNPSPYSSHTRSNPLQHYPLHLSRPSMLSFDHSTPYTQIPRLPIHTYDLHTILLPPRRPSHNLPINHPFLFPFPTFRPPPPKPPNHRTMYPDPTIAPSRFRFLLESSSFSPTRRTAGLSGSVGVRERRR
ncbi:hypothetical protein R3P38DRAFT_549182 [Favolaschia claudopus]|uniref:Uncharacterized protein n=1 Tax=Favolaschia claudopus TaxID=2862362 RepID=A0AAV9ZC54_9AGAR